MDKIITISRQYGSGGREIGKRAAEMLNIPFYDKEIIEKAETSSVGSFLYTVSESFSCESHYDILQNDKGYLAQCKVIKEIAEKGACIIIGRGACEVLQKDFPLLRVFIYAEMEKRKKRAVEEYGEPASNIEKRIKQIDKKRKSYYQFYEKKKTDWIDYFDLCINSGELGIDLAAELICDAYRR